MYSFYISFRIYACFGLPKPSSGNFILQN